MGSKPFPARPEHRITKLLQVNASPTLLGVSLAPGSSHGHPEPNTPGPANPRDPAQLGGLRRCPRAVGQPPGNSTPAGIVMEGLDLPAPQPPQVWDP